MTFSKTALLLGVALALSACGDNSPFGRDRFADSGGAGAAGLEANNGLSQSALDPASPQYFSQTIGDRVLFAVNEHDLTPEARATLTGQARWLSSNTSYRAIIEGHADEQGTREYNLALGARRASAARDYLVSQGVADNRLTTVTYGKERPIEVCSIEACYAQNRRAVTVISTGVGS